jgi:ribosomal protein S8
MLNQTTKNNLRHLLSIIRRESKNNKSHILLEAQKFSFINNKILKILYENGFIQSFELRGKFLLIRLKQYF